MFPDLLVKFKISLNSAQKILLTEILLRMSDSRYEKEMINFTPNIAKYARILGGEILQA